MDLQYLLTLETLAREKSFSKTAQVLHITQPTVTARIQALEAELGGKLFRRSSRGVELTPEGKAFLPYVSRCLAVLEEGREAVFRGADRQQDKLTLGAIPTIVYNELPLVVERFRQAFPTARVLVKTAHSGQLLEMLLDRVVQVGLVRSQVNHPAVRVLPLYDDPILLAAAPSHPLARRARISLRELAQEEVIGYDSNSSYWQWLEEIFREEGVSFHTALELESVDAIKSLVMRGAGVALLPRRSMQREMEQGQLAGIEVTARRPMVRSTVAIYRREKTLSRRLTSFLSLLRELFPSQEVAQRPAPGGAASRSRTGNTVCQNPER